MQYIVKREMSVYVKNDAMVNNVTVMLHDEKTAILFPWQTTCTYNNAMHMQCRN